VNDATPVVFVVDDDVSVRRAVGRCLKAAGLRVEEFASAEEFLSHPLPDAPACAVLDVSLPGLDGLELQLALAKKDLSPPVVFITGYGDIPMTVRAMKAGAVDFLPKPFRYADLLDAVTGALDRHARARQAGAEASADRRRAAALSPREHEVMALIVQGLLNKQVGHRLGVTEKTVKAHRARVMSKMGAGSLAELVRMAGRIDAAAPAP
jgi:FixJ family two-component response regulator